MKEIKVVLERTKETPGTFRYDAEDREKAMITAIYVRKPAMNGDEPPERVELIVRALDTGAVTTRKRSKKESDADE